MNTKPALLSLLLAAAVVAQNGQPDTKKPDGKQPATGEMPMPNPKHPEHEALRSLAGNWDIVMRSEAMPGVPGMEKATESKGTERAELVHGGLWLRSTTDGTHDGKPCQFIWLVGYDPFAKSYTGICAGSDDKEAISQWKGAYDQGKKEWTWSGKTSWGDMRSVVTFEGDDTMVETCYMTGTDGAEKKAMVITRKRSKSPATPTDAGASNAKLTGELASMQKDLGEWEASVSCTMAGQSMPAEKGTESVAACCGGKWIWSDFKGQHQGQAFTGSSLTGYDPTTKKIVMIWIDSMTPTWCRTEGAPAADNAELKLTGSCVDAHGKPMQVEQSLTRPDADTRKFRMNATCEQGPMTMEITYRRKAGGR